MPERSDIHNAILSVMAQSTCDLCEQPVSQLRIEHLESGEIHVEWRCCGDNYLGNNCENNATEAFFETMRSA